MLSLSVVLPAFNEAKNIESTVSNCKQILRDIAGDYEIIIVNDGSSDKTKEVAEGIVNQSRFVRLLNHEINLGYGNALNTGLENASKEFIFLMDSDGQFDFSEIKKLIPYLVENKSVVIGYRLKRADSFVRVVNTALYKTYIRLLFGLKVKDIDCAFKMFSRSAFDMVKPVRSRGALYSAELLIKFERKGCKITEVGINHYPRLYGEQSGANLSVILKMFKESWLFRNELK